MIKFYKNIFELHEIEKISNYLNSSNWKYGHKSNPNSIFCFWVMDLNNSIFFKKTLFKKIQEKIGYDYEIRRVYANGQTSEMNGDYHIDSNDSDYFTFLYYPMKEWNIEWEGPTIIIDSNQDKNFFYPIPNSALFFSSNLLHCGMGPSKKYKGLRVTIAYKLYKINNQTA